MSYGKSLSKNDNLLTWFLQLQSRGFLSCNQPLQNMKQLDFFFTILFSLVAVVLIPVHVPKLFQEPIWHTLCWLALDFFMIGWFTYKAYDKKWFAGKDLQTYSAITLPTVACGWVIQYLSSGKLYLLEMVWVIPFYVFGFMMWKLFDYALSGRVFNNKRDA